MKKNVTLAALCLKFSTYVAPFPCICHSERYFYQSPAFDADAPGAWYGGYGWGGYDWYRTYARDDRLRWRSRRSGDVLSSGEACLLDFHHDGNGKPRAVKPGSALPAKHD